MPPEAYPILSSSIWSYAPLVLLTIVALLWLYRWVRPAPPTPQTTASVQSVVPQPGKVPTHTGSRYIKEMNVYGGSVPTHMFPRYTFKFAKNIKSGRVVVDFSAFVGGVGGGWTVRKTLTLKELGPHARDIEFSEPLISADNFDSHIWRWGGTMDEPNRTNALMPQCPYRGRVVFQDDEGGETRRYFLIMQDSSTPSRRVPEVIGHQMFNFVAEWEDDDN